MASSKGKTRDRPAKKRITRGISHPDTRSQVKSVRRKRANTPYRRQPYNSISIPQLVYELLTIDKYNQEAKRFPSPERFETRSRRMQNPHAQPRFSYETIDRRDGSESIHVPEYTTESRPTSIDSMTEATDAANSPTSSANSSVSNVSMEPIKLANSLNSAKALFRKRSLVQLINSYIKAGIEEGAFFNGVSQPVYSGKRQAKKYIRKALSFGVRSGYLIPTDRQGNVLRVCPTLDTQSWGWSRVPKDMEARQKRRIARRGKMQLTTVADRKAMRRGIPRDKSFHNVDDGRMASKKRCRTRLAESPTKNLNTRESKSPLGKSPDKSLRERNKLKVFARKNKNNSTMNNEREQQRKKDENIKKSVKKRRLSSSAKCAENNCEPVGESYEDVRGKNRDQYKSNEDNYRVQRRKSTSSHEDESRTEEQKTETNNDRIDCDRIENRNSDDEDNDKRSEKGSVEHDVNDSTNREMKY